MAVNAAEKAYTTWSKLTPHARARYLYRQESSSFKAFGIFVVTGLESSTMNYLYHLQCRSQPAEAHEVVDCDGDHGQWQTRQRI